MKQIQLALIFLVVLAGISIAAPAAPAQQPCEKLKSLKITNVTITEAQSYRPSNPLVIPIPASPFAAAGKLTISGPICRVRAYSTPTEDSHITFEIWLPNSSRWNGKFEAVGNGGFIGQINYNEMSAGLKRDFAIAATDTGHTSADESWALGHPEKLVDWSYRAVHEMTIASKQIVKAYYGAPAKLAYWDGCSTGGKQGLTEAQKYPEDFDGIVAGAPANYITRLQAGSEYMSWVSLKDGTGAPEYIPPSKYPVLHEAALDACDALDGVKDGVIEDPTRCHFNPKTIECKGEGDAACLTTPQVKTAQEIYAGAKFANGKQIYPGLEPGSELAWNYMAGGPEPTSIGTGFFKFMVFDNPNWDFRTFDADRDTRYADKKLGSIVNAIDPNLSAFEGHGGKLVMYHGWADQLIAPENSVNYYRSVVSRMGGLRKTQQFARLFMAPGMMHCQGGAGPSTFDALTAVEKWREQGVAPMKIIASKSVEGKVVETRPLCPYPQVAIYKGSGDTNDAASFVCGNAKW
ncbi:MAG: tannase/feruloyl esterase family alpha/beta hydrolase [Acidobacteriota bacterium]|nr:tannase/feruloyl esterase family alpha/beta hydrolase [Acidobacteriota bacterium]